MLDVLSVGNANVDLLVHSKSLRTNESLRVFPGGSAVNFSVGCARLGLKSGFLGFVGEDSFGELILKTLKSEGVQSFAKKVSGHTGIVEVFSEHRFKKFFKFNGVNEKLKSLKLKSYFTKARHLHLATPPLELLTQIPKSKKFTVSADPGSRLSKYPLSELDLTNIDLFFPNESEARLITGCSYKKAADRLLEAGLKVAVIKRGNGGVYVKSRDESFKTRSIDYPVTDTTGAGDAFASAFTSAWLQAKSLKEAATWGIISSNVCVTRIGAQNSATLKELKTIQKTI